MKIAKVCGFLLGQWKYSKIDCGDGCINLWVYEKRVNCTLNGYNKAILKKQQQKNLGLSALPH